MRHTPELTQYTKGPRFYTASAEHGFAFGHVERAIAAANAALPGYHFEAEPITEGGICLRDWPGREKTSRAHKSLRLGIHNWPWLPLRPDANNKRSEVLVGHEPNPSEFATFLKAFDAPGGWTDLELRTLTRCMESAMGVTFGPF